MKILIASELFWPEGGGAEYATYLITRILYSLGYKIVIVTGTENPLYINDIKIYHASILRNSNRIKRFSYVRLLGAFKWFKRLLEWCDVLYIPLASYPLIPLAKKLGKRVIVHVHNLVPAFYQGVKYFNEPLHNDFTNNFKYGIIHEYYINKSIMRTLAMPFSYVLHKVSQEWIREADTVIAVSKWQANVLCKLTKIPCSKIKVVYNPLPEIATHIRKQGEYKRDYVIYGGGSSIIKGFPIALSIALKKQNSKYCFIFSGLDQKSLSNFLKLQESLDFIRFLPHISRNIFLKYVARSKFLLFTSLIEEPSPYSIVEAILLNTIPLAGKLGGIPEILGPLYNRFCVEFSGDIIQNFIHKFEELESLSLEEIQITLSITKEYIMRNMDWLSIADKLQKIIN